MAPLPSEPLRNVRHERFCLALAEGLSHTAAYQKAGYRQTASATANAARLITKDSIKSRLAHLQAMAARSTEITIESICRELDEANQIAKANGQASAMVSASTLRAKLAGLLTERIEAKVSVSGFDGCESAADMADQILSGPGGPVELFRPLDERDRQGLIDLLERHESEFGEFMSAIKARPITAVRCDLTQLKPNWKELELHPSAYVDNPAQRRWDEIKRQREQLQRKRIGNGNRR
jgi:terminase small subunit-like protein